MYVLGGGGGGGEAYLCVCGIPPPPPLMKNSVTLTRGIMGHFEAY